MLDTFTGLARLTLKAPREGARAVLAWPLNRTELWQIAGVLVVASVIVSQVSNFLMPLGGAGPMATIMASPFLNAGIQAGLLVVTVTAVDRIGRAFGGKGDFLGALKLIVWLQMINLAIQIIQFFALLVAPPVAGLIGIASLLLFFWLLTQFVTELHGFESGFHVFVGIVISAFAIILGLSVVLALLSVLIPGGMPSV
ncbi:YIP1 family protein [Maritimibacter sp. 55A14]|uniref:YIP1 family protein n=1 Tax=Maritimibacter sp. 55A14 TaxID=2174844 RepID=UPI000D60CD1B|nr:YIP1 family protein [Maritimibacter sp. 55A14]PWE33113.1 YIP1 family protein [Maritimibacter sp. 55A14]